MTRRRLVPVAIVGAIAVVAFAVAVGITLFRADEGGPLPAFESLASNPDRSLHGTVAYYADDPGCIRLVAAAGQPSTTLWCLPADDPSTWPGVGKPVGPQLVWLPDGRLEVTVFRMQAPPQGTTGTRPDLAAGWQVIVDPATGAVTEVPAADVPGSPNLSTQPTVSPSGAEVTWTASGPTGHVKVELTDESGTRTLLSVHGPGSYGYSFGPVFWAPNWEWIAASDEGRILVITPTDPAVTRVLVDGIGRGLGGGTAGPAFAVTAADLLAPTG